MKCNYTERKRPRGFRKNWEAKEIATHLSTEYPWVPTQIPTPSWKPKPTRGPAICSNSLPGDSDASSSVRTTVQSHLFGLLHEATWSPIRAKMPNRKENCGIKNFNLRKWYLLTCFFPWGPGVLQEVILAAHFCAVHGTQTKSHWNLHVISTKSVLLIQTGADS